MSKLFWCSLNKTVVNKASREQFNDLATKLSPEEITQSDLLYHLTVKGHPICCANLTIDKSTGFARRHGESFKWASVVGVDVDHGETPFHDLETDDYLRQFAAFAYTTHSHTEANPRYRIIFITEEPIRNQNDYKALTTALSQRYKGDTNARDSVRIWYGAQNAQVINWGNTLPISEVSQMIEGADQERVTEIAYKAFGNKDFRPSDVESMLKHIPPQQDHIRWKKVCAAVYDALKGDLETSCRLLEAWSPSKVSYREVLKNRLTKVTAATLVYYAVEGGYNLKHDFYKVDAKDTNQIMDKVETYLTSSAEFRKNVVTGKIEYRSEHDVKWSTITDYYVNSMLRQMRKFNIKVTKDRINEVLDSDFSQRHDPIKSYFDGLPEWLAGDRDYIREYAELLPIDPTHPESAETQTEFFVMVLRKWLIGAVATSLDHKPNHIMLILQGGQGIGKTTFLRHLCPLELRREYYYEGQLSNEKDVQLALVRSFMAVDDELESMTKKEIESIKALITSDTQRIRAHYDRHEQNFPRRCSFAGSVNRRSFLNDETGSRRFAVIPIGGNMDIESIRAFDVDMIWSQALAQYRHNVPYWLDARETLMVTEWNKSFEVATHYDDLVSKYVRAADAVAGRSEVFMTTSEIAARLAQVVLDHEKVILQINDKFIYGLGKALAKANIPRVAKKRSERSQRGYNVIVARQHDLQNDERSAF